MKKYLLLLGCACMALSALADDTDINKVRTHDFGSFTVSATSIVVTRYTRDDNPITHGGKPRLPERPVRNGNPDPACDGTTSYNYLPGHVELVAQAMSSVKGVKETLGGKPRLPEKPLSTGPGTVSLFSKDDGSTMSNMHVGGERNFVKADLVEFGKEPLGGKPRDPGRPLSIDDFLNNVRNNSSFSSSKPTIDDVTSLIDQLLYEGQGQAKSVNDVTTMIDQMLIQPK
jgi:hypothetical protein